MNAGFQGLNLWCVCGGGGGWGYVLPIFGIFLRLSIGFQVLKTCPTPPAGPEMALFLLIVLACKHFYQVLFHLFHPSMDIKLTIMTKQTPNYILWLNAHIKVKSTDNPHKLLGTCTMVKIVLVSCMGAQGHGCMGWWVRGVLTGKVGTGMCGPDRVLFRALRFINIPFFICKLV